MKRCWLHIGMHKTGSTSLQLTLGQAKNPVGWKYITVGGGSNIGAAAYAMFASNGHEHDLYRKRGHTPKQVARYGAKLRVLLASAITASNEENLIISAESLSRIDKDGITAIRDFLQPLCDEIRVIGYVRPPIGFKISYFQQRLKHQPSPFKLHLLRLKYRERFEKFDQLFGKENVILRKFEPASFKNNCVVHDFCEQIGIQEPEAGSVVRVNESLSREACGILYAYRKFGPAMGVGKDVIKVNKQMLAPLLAMQGTKFGIPRELVIASLAKEAKDLKWMEERLGTSLSEDSVDRGTEVAGEEVLLTIKGLSCSEYAARFEEIHGIHVPEGIVPKGSPVEPAQVAEFMGYCQSLCLERLEKARALKSNPKSKRPVAKNFRLIRRCWKYLKKKVGVTQGK